MTLKLWMSSDSHSSVNNSLDIRSAAVCEPVLGEPRGVLFGDGWGELCGDWKGVCAPPRRLSLL